MKKTIFTISAFLGLLAPALAFAQTPNFGYVNTVVNQGTYWLQDAVTIIMIVMTLFFLYSVLRFIMDKGGKPEDTKAKRQAMVNGLVGLFIAVGVWGIIHLAGSVTGVNTTNPDQQTAITCPPGFKQTNGVCQPNQ